MSDITITCPSCNQELEVPQDLLGQVVGCRDASSPYNYPHRRPQTPDTRMSLSRNDDLLRQPVPQRNAPLRSVVRPETLEGNRGRHQWH